MGFVLGRRLRAGSHISGILYNLQWGGWSGLSSCKALFTTDSPESRRNCFLTILPRTQRHGLTEWCTDMNLERYFSWLRRPKPSCLEHWIECVHAKKKSCHYFLGICGLGIGWVPYRMTNAFKATSQDSWESARTLFQIIYSLCKDCPSALSIEHPYI